jgi:Flp pilus assembly pilin Flp
LGTREIIPRAARRIFFFAILSHHLSRDSFAALQCFIDNSRLLRKLWSEEQGQDIAEYAVMPAVILVLVVGTIRLIGGNANNVFSAAASSVSP